MKILIIKLSAAGDVVLITPSLRAIRIRYPEAQVYCLVGEAFKDLLKDCPYLDQLIIYAARKKSWWQAIKTGYFLRKYSFDIVIDFQNNKKSHLMGFLSGAKARYGFHRKWGFLLTAPEPDHHSTLPAVPHQFQILKHLGISEDSPSFLELWPSEEDRLYAQKLLLPASYQKKVIISIAASHKWHTKRWPWEYIAALCDDLEAHHVKPILVGVKEDLPLADMIIARCIHQPMNCVGKTSLNQLAALIAQGNLFIGPDSAALHIAAAVRVPFVALFGPTSAQRHLPPHETGVIIQKKIACAPCYKQACPLGTHQCMKDISVAEIRQAVFQLLAE